MRLLRHRQFRVLFIGLLFSMFGDSVLLITFGIWVKTLTGSTAAAGATFLMLALPALAAPFGGWVIDRVRRRPFIIGVNLGTAALVLCGLFVRTKEQHWLLLCIVFGYGASLIMTSSAMNGLLKTMLPDDLLVDANGLLQTVKEGMRLIGPLVGAGLFAVFGGPAVLIVDACSLVIAAAILAVVHVHEPGPEPASQHIVAAMTAGVRFLRGERVLGTATLVCGVGFLVFGFVETIGFAVVDTGLHQPPTFIGVMASMQGIGAIAGGLTVPWIVRRYGELVGVACGLAAIAAGVGVMVVALVPVVLAGSLLLGLGIPWAFVAFFTLLQRRTPNALMGRVGAAVDVVLGVPQTVSIGMGALAVGLVDFRVLIAVMAAVLLACGGFLVWTSVATREVAREHDARVGD